MRANGAEERMRCGLSACPRSVAEPLRGRVALVTGAGRGIGRAVAMKPGGAGASVVVNDLTSDVVSDAVDAIRAAGGGAVGCPGDVTADEFPAQSVWVAVETLGSIDIVVNNAGYSTYADAITMSDRQWSRMVDVLLTAPFRILRAVGEQFRDRAGRP